MNWRESKIDSGSIGSGLRRSARTNATALARPTAIAPITAGEPRPFSGAWISPKVSPASASEANAEPRKSSRPLIVGSRVSGTWRLAAQTTNAPSGMLIRKIARQLTASISQPPTSGPTAAATPPSADQAPIARPRSSGWKLASMIARLPGVSRAPPMPCTTRAAIRTSMLGATAQRADAPTNQITPMLKIRRRP